MGFSISIPLRIFDRNQGERLRTRLDINRTERVRAAAEAQLYNDVDSAHAALAGTVVLLKPYKERYLEQAVKVRDTMTFSYERGGASLLDFLGGPARLPERSAGIPESRRVVFVRFGAAQSCSRPGGGRMKRLILFLLSFLVLCALAVLLFSGCGRKEKNESGAPPPVQVEREQDAEGFQVERPEQFQLVAAGTHKAAPELTVTGVVSPDVARTIPAVSLASGRAVEIKVRLGDTVTKGQLLMRVKSTDIAAAYSEFRQATADETLAKTQLERARVLYEKGAIAQKDLEVATDVESKARVIRETAIEKLHTLGVTRLDRSPGGVVDVYSPISGVIIEQNVTAGAGVKSLDNSPNLFTIANLDNVWIMCDVYENDSSFIRIGDYADVRLNAYPGKEFKGRISNIGPILDPTTRTSKVRLEMKNPGFMRIGMFVTATFYGHTEEVHATVPATAVLHLQDRDWVYLPLGGGKFRRAPVTGKKMLPATCSRWWVSTRGSR